MNDKGIFDNSPIIAITTGTGNAGVGIIRISGSDSDIQKIYEILFPGKELRDRYALLLPVHDQNKEIIDKGLVIYFKAPFSYTGECVLELQMHGGRVALEYILKEVLSQCSSVNGFRLANPGEFTERAFLNGKIDLVQAEAIADLINASSVCSVKAAGRSLRGEFSKLVSKLNNLLVNLRVETEAILDFPEEEIDFLNQYEIRSKYENCVIKLKDLISKAKDGEVLRDGLRIAIIGETNVGKSSLLNLLAGEDVAIVSDIAGTTRDRIVASINVSGIPFHFVDTAGIRETNDIIENIGIERSKQEISKADAILLIKDIRDHTNKNSKEINLILEKIKKKDLPVIEVLNKVDLVENDFICKNVSRETSLLTSTITGEGIKELRDRLIQLSGISNQSSVYSARERHVQLLSSSLVHLLAASEYLSEKEPQLEFFAEELKISSDKLGEIIGQTTTDDILGKIFSGFCIGK